MPELPEVETMRRGILSIVGGRVAAAERLPCARRPITVEPGPAALRKRLVGRTVVAVDRLGKRVVVRFDSGDSLLFEPRMTGLVLMADPPTIEHLRFRLTLDDGRTVDYWDRRGLGSVRLLSATQLAERYAQGALGPDALAISADEFRARLGNSRRAIKVALLDQRAVAGIGNLYASEMLFAAKIAPRRRCTGLTSAEWRRLYEAMRAVLEEAVRCEGSTLGDGTYRNALNQACGYQNHHRVYDREGAACYDCRTTSIRRIVQAQRSTFYCPTCQTPRR